MKTLLQHFRPAMEEGIRNSRWFRTAPKEFQATAKIKILGVDSRTYHCTSRARPALIAECECGGDVQRFSMLLDDFNGVETTT